MQWCWANTSGGFMGPHVAERLQWLLRSSRVPGGGRSPLRARGGRTIAPCARGTALTPLRQQGLTGK